MPTTTKVSVFFSFPSLFSFFPPQPISWRLVTFSVTITCSDAVTGISCPLKFTSLEKHVDIQTQQKMKKQVETLVSLHPDWSGGKGGGGDCVQCVCVCERVLADQLSSSSIKNNKKYLGYFLI